MSAPGLTTACGDYSQKGASIKRVKRPPGYDCECNGDFSPTTSVCRALGACDFNVRSTSTGYCSDLGSDLFFGVFLFNRAISSPAEGGAFTLPPRIMSLALSFCR